MTPEQSRLIGFIHAKYGIEISEQEATQYLDHAPRPLFAAFIVEAAGFFLTLSTMQALGIPSNAPIILTSNASTWLFILFLLFAGTTLVSTIWIIRTLWLKKHYDDRFIAQLKNTHGFLDPKTR